MLRVPPSVYTLCWCGTMFAPGGVCNETASFDMPAGQIRVGTSKEFMFVSRVADPEPRTDEAMYALLLLAPLALVACALAFLGWKRVTPVNNRHFAEAPPPFTKRKAWASGEQDRLKLEDSVKRVASQRKLAVGELDAKDAHDMLEIDMPDFTGRKEVSVEIVAAEALRNSIADSEGKMMIEDETVLKLKSSRSQAKSLTNVDEEDAESAMDRTPSKQRASSRKKKKGFFDKLKRMFSRQEEDPDDLELRGIRDMGRRASQLGGNSGPSMGLSEDVGPASPTAQWEKEWDEDDGPMPPGMNFSFNDDEARKQVVLKILDME